jgi:N-acetylmuramate 1-kinase
MNGAREGRIGTFLAAHGWGGARRTPLAGDASVRRYERLEDAGRRAILMDSPAPAEDVVPFIAVGGLLARTGLSVPAILAEASGDGLLLLEDFGDDTFSRLLAAGEDAAALYALAVDALILLHRRFDPADPAAAALPLYDEATFLDQVMLFADAYLPAAFGRPPSPAERTGLAEAWRSVLPAAAALPRSLLHRDFHVDNLMRLPGHEGASACGILDFQGAGIGPVCYDLVSLLEEARRDVPAPLAAAMTERYLTAFPALDRAAFADACAVTGAVRHARIVAVFARLWLRDGRPGYLGHLPRVWRLLEARLAHPALAPVRLWFDRHLPPAARAPLFASKASER